MDLWAASALYVLAVGQVETSSQALETIVVTASRTEQEIGTTAVPTQVIGRAQIEMSGAENLTELLEEFSGVQINRGFAGAEIQLQGLGSEYVLVLVDGQRVAGRINNVLDLNRFNVELIERVEVLKGAASALYGADAMGGVINIITRPGEDGLNAEGHVAYGSRNMADISGVVSGGWESWSSRLTAGYHRSDAFDLTPEDVETTGSAAESVNADASTLFRFGPSARLRLRGDYLYQAFDGVAVNNSGAVLDQRTRRTTGSVQVAPSFYLDDEHSVDVILSGSLFDNQSSDDQRGNSGRDSLDRFTQTKEYLGQATIQYTGQWSDRHKVVIGAETLYQRVETPRIPNSPFEQGRVSAFVQDEWTVLDRTELSIQPGVRALYDTEFGGYAAPRLAVRFAPLEGLVLRASGGLGFRPPEALRRFIDFENTSAGYQVCGNPDLEPERSYNANAGFIVAPARWLNVTVDAFWNELDNLIAVRTVDPDDNPCPFEAPNQFSYVNVARAQTYGVESMARFNLKRYLSLSVGYTLTETRDLDEDVPLEGRARHRGTLLLRGHWKAIGLNGLVRGVLVGPRPFYDFNADGSIETEDEPSYALVDVRLTQSIFDGITWSIGVDNIFDVGDHETLQVLPLTVYGGLDVRY